MSTDRSAFIGVVEHEFTEDMGRIDLFGADIGGTTNSYSLLDLYHYTSLGVHTYTATATNYFSVDGGTTNLDYFNTNPNGDLGDWASSAGDDSFLAFSPSGEADPVSQTDITEMRCRRTSTIRAQTVCRPMRMFRPMIWRHQGQLRSALPIRSNSTMAMRAMSTR